jgi:methionyl-tRNA synthetase
MVSRYRNGTLRALPSADGVIAGALEPLGADVAARLDAFDITGALERIWDVVRTLNREVETTAPWQLAKDDARADDLDRVLYDLVDGLRAVAVALSPYVPDTAASILSALQQAPALDWPLVAYGLTAETHGIEAAPPLFPRLEQPAA